MVHARTPECGQDRAGYDTIVQARAGMAEASVMASRRNICRYRPSLMSAALRWLLRDGGTACMVRWKLVGAVARRWIVGRGVLERTPIASAADEHPAGVVARHFAEMETPTGPARFRAPVGRMFRDTAALGTATCTALGYYQAAWPS